MPGAARNPFVAVWHWCTALREHRGDGHVAALLAAGLGALDSLVLHAAADGPRTFLQTRRGFSPQEWAAGEAALRDRGLVGPDGSATPEGRRLRAEVERHTDASARVPGGFSDARARCGWRSC